MDRKKRQRRLLVEGLEQRRLLAVLTDVPTAPIPTLEEFTEPRNIGTVQAFNFNESETTGEAGLNDTISNADFVNLGNGPGQEDTVDITGSLPLRSVPNPVSGTRADIDTFEVNLKAGDILDIATIGAAGGLTVQYGDGTIWFGTDFNVGGFGPYPASSPLQDAGNNTAAQVVPEDGTYYISVAPIGSGENYTMGLRTYRPVSEQLTTGDSQIIYLDFDGGFVDANVFNEQFDPDVPVPGVARFYGFDQSLPLFGLERGDTEARDFFIDTVISELSRIMEDLGDTGTNGDFTDSGRPGDYGIRILNSRDHGGLVSEADPRVTRLLIGGTNATFGTSVDVLGVSESVDLGNFDMSELVAMPLEFYLPSVQAFPLSPTASLLEASAVFMGAVAAHEAGHSFGMWHTDPNNSIETTSDAGGTQNSLGALLGVGPDGIFGTLDDEPSTFREDFFTPSEFYFGVEPIAAALSQTLSTGTEGGRVVGTVFRDTNANGVQNNDEGGLSGVTVFADLNRNGVLEASEPSDVTAGNGRYSLAVAAGSYRIMAQTPSQFLPTTPRSQGATVTVGSNTTGIDFGFQPITAEARGNITGTKFFDENENGIFDPGEPGIEGVHVYLDLDGDDRIDLAEPRATTNAKGKYSITPPRNGTFTVREVLQPGFTRTFPESGEHVVIFNGTGSPGNDFGNFQARDFGDAPASYGDPSHGITEGITLGALIDREDASLHTAAADGDDNTGIDDEDALELLSPLAAGATGTVAVTVNNDTGSGFLQAWVDLNRNGSFDDGAEQIITDRVLATGRHQLDIDIPANVDPGEYFVRLRYSQSPGLGPVGEADAGEVEDHLVTIRGDVDVAADDRFFVTRNSINNQLLVLANDFQTPDNQLTIVDQNLSGTLGAVVRDSNNQSFSYTPPTGFLGTDTFTYTVEDEFGFQSTAEVTVNVSFLSDQPIAVDDSYEIPAGSSDFPLDVLENDLASTEGGLTITGVGPGTAGGTINFTDQQILYTPPTDAGFNGTEQFTYTVADPAGNDSTATVTVNSLPGSRDDDVVAFSIDLTDTVNNNPITDIQVGEQFRMTVSVDDLGPDSFTDPQGVATAFLDVLYNDSLVLVDQAEGIQFGPLFGGGGSGIQNVDFDTPGLINETGASQKDLTNLVEHADPAELFTVTLEAIAPGEAVFKADPADAVLSETIVIGSDVVLEPHELRLGQANLRVRDASNNFPSAIDDSFPLTLDSSGNQSLALDSEGNPITPSASAPNVLDVLANDNFGTTGTITDFNIDVNPQNGTVNINNNGTPNDPTDDFVEYDAVDTGFDSFTYSIVSGDGVRSTAKVTLNSGTLNPGDLLVNMDLEFVDTSGTPVTSVGVGDTVGLRINVDDLRGGFDESFVFAAFLDVLYDSDNLRPIETSTGLGFDVDFGENFDPNAASGFIDRPGIIDEFGTNDQRSDVSQSQGTDPRELATVFFTATAAGTATATGSPADRFPFRDTLLFGRDEPVPVDRIVFDTAELTVGASAEGEAPLQNTVLPADVNDDSYVTAMDALLVINELNSSGATAGAEGEMAATSRYFTDVNGDRRVSALDALQVINFLNSNSLAQAGGEGEAIPAPGSSDEEATADSTLQSDAVFAEFDAESPLVGGSSVQQADPMAVAAAASADSDDEEEEDDDVLRLLADDVAELWA